MPSIGYQDNKFCIPCLAKSKYCSLSTSFGSYFYLAFIPCCSKLKFYSLIPDSPKVREITISSRIRASVFRDLVLVNITCLDLANLIFFSLKLQNYKERKEHEGRREGRSKRSYVVTGRRDARRRRHRGPAAGLLSPLCPFTAFSESRPTCPCIQSCSLDKTRRGVAVDGTLIVMQDSALALMPMNPSV